MAEGTASMALVNLRSGESTRDRLGQASALYQPFFAYYDAAVSDPDIDPTSLELCRLRIAQLLGAPGLGDPVPQARVTADAAQSVASWPTDPRTTPEQRACLTFAEQFLLDAQGLEGEQVEGVREALGDRGLTAFVLALGVIEQFQRLLLLLDPEIAGPAPKP